MLKNGVGIMKVMIFDVCVGGGIGTYKEYCVIDRAKNNIKYYSFSDVGFRIVRTISE